MSKKKSGYIKGALIISIGGFLSKAMGAAYRIPLTNILGGAGMGVYQMVYPLYCMLLTVSASGIPSGIARLTASGKGEGAEKTAFAFYGVLGALGSFLMFALSDALAALQGEPSVALCCKMLSPSVFFVSVLSVARGYFQGRSNMYPTALTEVAEQLLKVLLGCALAWHFKDNFELAVASTLFAVTASEAVCALSAYAYYIKKRPRAPLYKVFTPPVFAVLKYTVPLALSAAAVPLAGLAESIAVVRLLKDASLGSTAVYGIYSGCAVTIVNLPVSITYGLAASAIPKIAPLAETDMRAAKEGAMKALLLTFVISLPAAVGLFVLAPIAAKTIFGALSAGEREIFINLVRIMCISAITQPVLQTSCACLTAFGRPLSATLANWLCAALRVSLAAAALRFTPLGINGVALAANCAYFVASLLSFCYIIKAGGTNENNADRFGNFKRRFNFARKGGA